MQRCDTYASTNNPAKVPGFFVRARARRARVSKLESTMKSPQLPTPLSLHQVQQYVLAPALKGWPDSIEARVMLLASCDWVSVQPVKFC